MVETILDMPLSKIALRMVLSLEAFEGISD